MERYMELFARCVNSRKMRGRLMRSLILGILIAGVPGLAWATPTINAVVGNNAGSPAANGDVTSTADCTSGGVVTGGGITITTSADGVMAGNAQRLEGTEPSGDGTNSSANNTYNARYWLGVDGAGGMNDGNGADRAWAMCDGSATWTGGTTITSVTGPYPSTSLSAVPVTVGCPAGSHLISGGGYSSPPNGAMKLIASYPSDGSGVPVANAATTLDHWTAIAWVGGSGGSAGDFTQVWAVCAKNAVSLKVVQTTVSGPNSGSLTTKAVSGSSCSSTLANSTVVGGGYAVDSHSGNYVGGSDTFTQSANSGDHAVGSYPSDSSGNTVTSGNPAQYWTSDGHSGGSTSGGSFTHVWAICGA
jgi:hypothetical protein